MKLLSLVLLSFSASAIASCPGHVRFIHGDAFRDGEVSVRLNGREVQESLKFREVTDYRPVRARKYKVEFVNRQSGEVLDTKTFTVGPNLGYSIFMAGPAKGPAGMMFGNTSPFVFLDDITPVANPNRWKGTWYRMSETNVVIDFRLSNGNNYADEVSRLRKKENRSAYQLGDHPAGFYNFNPVLVDSSEPFFNPALNPAKIVEIKGVTINGMETMDVFALGNFLGKAPNSLDLTYKKYTSFLGKKGCFEIKQ